MESGDLQWATGVGHWESGCDRVGDGVRWAWAKAWPCESLNLRGQQADDRQDTPLLIEGPKAHWETGREERNLKKIVAA